MRGRPVRRGRRASPRGVALLLALGLVTLVTMVVLMGFTLVGRESEVQGEARRQREAFWAAEAGLAEGRERVRLLLGSANDHSWLLANLPGGVVTETGVPPGRYYEVLSWQAYTLQPAALAASELNAPDGNPYPSWPEQANVRYRVLVRDDNDDALPASDLNARVWLVAVGEVQGRAGSQPVRAVVQALVTSAGQAAAATPGCVGRGCGPAMDLANSRENPVQTLTPRAETL